MKLKCTKIVAFKTLDISQGSVATHLRCGGTATLGCIARAMSAALHP